MTFTKPPPVGAQTGSSRFQKILVVGAVGAISFVALAMIATILLELGVINPYPFFAGRNPSVAHSKKVLSAAMASDADKLWDLMHPVERSSLGASREEWRAFVKGYFKPMISKYKRDGQVITYGAPQEGGVAGQRLISSTGRPSRINFETRPLGSPLCNISQSMVKFAVRERTQDAIDDIPPDDVWRREEVMAERLREQVPLLRKIGLPGFYDCRLGRLVLWKDWLKLQDEASKYRITQYERQLESAPQPGQIDRESEEANSRRHKEHLRKLSELQDK